MNVLLVGAGGGIGGALLEQLTPVNSTNRILATHHRPVSSAHADVEWLTLDFTSTQSIQTAAREITCRTTELDLTIIASGMLHASGIQPEKSLSQVELEQLQQVCSANALGPATLLASLAPVLKRSNAPRIVVLSAQVGSIGDNQLGGWYGYRMAKAALNMGVRCIAIEASRWRNHATVVALHPGTTLTGLSAPFVARRVVPPQSARSAAQRIEAFAQRLKPEMTGGFYQCNGETLPW